MSAITCQRCGVALAINPDRNEAARLLRHAEWGVCANCAMTEFLKTMEPLATVLKAKGPEMLLVPAVQTQVAAVLAAGEADAAPGEISWPTVVAQWAL